MKKIIFFLPFLVFSFVAPCAALDDSQVTQTPPVLSGGILPGPSQGEMQVHPEHGVDYIKDRLIPGLVNMFMMVLLALSVGMLVLAGYFFMFNVGGAETKEKAKNVVLWTIMAVVFAILAVVIVRLVIGLHISLP